MEVPDNNLDPVIEGMLDTLPAKVKSEKLADKILGGKTALANAVVRKNEDNFCSKYYKSDQNKLRSLNIYYSQNVLGKRKYISIRKANKVKNIPNFTPYSDLSKVIRQIDIGVVSSIKPILTQGMEDDESSDVLFRDLLQYAPRLAEFYLTVNENRVDKLKTFDGFPRKQKESKLFLVTIGGDEAPGSGTAFLISFLNVGKRIASSFENYLIFGGDVKEDGRVVLN